MPPPVLPALDLAAQAESGLSLRTLSYIGAVSVACTPDNVSTVQTFIQDQWGRCAVYVDTTSRGITREAVLQLLEAGATAIVVPHGLRHALLDQNSTIDPARLLLQASGRSTGPPAAVTAISSSSATGLWIDDIHPGKDLDSWVWEYARTAEHGNGTTVYVTYGDETAAIAQAGSTNIVPVVNAKRLTTNLEPTGSSTSLASVLLARATTDRPDGLFPTLVTNERGISLGLVYSSAESVAESLRTGQGVYQSRKRGLWYKGASSGDVQELIHVGLDCDHDCLQFVVRQKGRGFCHLPQPTCFGSFAGLERLQRTLMSRKATAPEGSYTARLFGDQTLLHAKIREEAEELCEAKSPDEVAWEAADLLYFALTKCVAMGVSLEDVERNLDMKDAKVKRRKGDAKQQWVKNGTAISNGNAAAAAAVNVPTSTIVAQQPTAHEVKEAVSIPKAASDPAGIIDGRIRMKRLNVTTDSPQAIEDALKRPSQRSTEKIMSIVNPIISAVRDRGDVALLEYTHKFDKATTLTSPVITAPFPPHLMQLPPETIAAIDTSFDNIRRFHAAQAEPPLEVETMPGVVCSRFSRPIERVGLYVPGGTAVLPSSALMLGAPALVAGCRTIVLATPPRADGSITPEIVYAAHKIGATCIVLAGGAQAVAALAYGTQSVPKVDKILGPGNQFVTAAKMLVSNDTSARVAIDMPAGPSEVLVVADETAQPAFVAADLLSQAEHGVDSQVVCLAVGLNSTQVQAIEDALHTQASALPRVDIVRGAIEHSVLIVVPDITAAIQLSNEYAPEHLILQIADPVAATQMVQHAGSVFQGPWTPESVGDYSAGVNHSLPTYGYARQYSGVNLGSYVKHITASNLTEQGLRNVGPAVMQLAKVEELEAHRRAVSIRLAHLDGVKG